MTDETRTSLVLPLGAFAKVNDKLLAEVYDLANFSEDRGFPQLSNAVELGSSNKNITAIAQTINDLRKSEMFMIRGAANDLYPRWCEAFGLEIDT